MAADWHELMIPQQIMRPSILSTQRAVGLADDAEQLADVHHPNQPH